MNILFLIQGWQVAASRYRVLQYIPYLNSKGIGTEAMPYPGTLKEYFQFFNKLPHYDCVFLQRKRFHQPFLKLLRKRAKKIIFDFDDAVMFRNSKAASPYSSTRLRRFAAMIQASDYVIAGNSFLKDQAAKFTEDVTVIPTAIEHSRYSAKKYNTVKDKVTIGWIGDHGSIHYLQKIRPVFEELGKKYTDLELQIICDTFFDCTNIKVVKKIWSHESEVEDLKNMDIGVMPLIDDPWSWGKCGLKILQYFGVAVPAVCTPVGVNKDVVREGFNGFYAMSREEWVQKLSILIENPEKRKDMGIKGMEIVKESFSVQACAPKLYRILQEVTSK